MNFSLASAFLAGGFIAMLINYLLRDKCQHECKFLHTLESFYESNTTIPAYRRKVYQCTKCLESKKVEV